MLINGCDTGTHFDAFHMLDFLAHLNQCPDRIECLAGCRIQMDDDINVRPFCNILYILIGRILMHAEAEPHVRRH